MKKEKPYFSPYIEKMIKENRKKYPNFNENEFQVTDFYGEFKKIIDIENGKK